MKRNLLKTLAFILIGTVFFIGSNSSSIETSSLEISEVENKEISVETKKSSVATLAAADSYFWTENSNYYSVNWSGSGTIEDPYIISTAEELAGLAYQTRFTNNHYSGVYFKQTADIDLSDHLWNPIGRNASYYFGGVYDGGGHTISGIFTSSNNSNIGLFGYVYGTENNVAVIKNLAITDSLISGSDSVGSIAGNIQGYTYIFSCYNTSQVDGETYSGGIVGKMSQRARIYNCYNTGNISSTATTSYTSSGGIVGVMWSSYSFVYNCYNTGSVYDPQNAGGIVGCTFAGTYVYNCYNTGSVSTGESGVAGGIAASIRSNGAFNNYYGGNCSSDVGGNGGMDDNGTSYLETIVSDAKSTAWYKEDNAIWNSSYPWDFTDVWAIVSGANDGYPILQWQKVFAIANIELDCSYLLESTPVYTVSPSVYGYTYDKISYSYIDSNNASIVNELPTGIEGTTTVTATLYNEDNVVATTTFDVTIQSHNFVYSRTESGHGYICSNGCGATQSFSEHTPNYVTNSNGTHNIVCGDSNCNYTIDSNVPCSYEYEDNEDGSTHNYTCAYCGYDEPNISGEEHDLSYHKYNDDTHYALCSKCQYREDGLTHSYTINKGDKHTTQCICEDTYRTEHEYALTSISDTQHNQVCTICGEQDPSSTASDHNLVYQNAGTNVGHYQICSEGCGYDTSVTPIPHSYVLDTDSDGHANECICGATNDIEHTYEWQSKDSTTHEYKCTTCGVVANEESHSDYLQLKDSNNGSTHYYECSRCYYTTTPVEHSYSIDLDDGHNTTQCECGAIKNGDHTYIYVDDENNSTHTYKCSSCSTEYNGEYDRNHEMEWVETASTHYQKCKYCTYQTTVAEHSYIVIKENDNRHYCECGAVGTTYHGYVYVNNENGTHTYKCQNCGDEVGTYNCDTVTTNGGSRGHYEYCATCGYTSTYTSHNLVQNESDKHLWECSESGCDYYQTTSHNYRTERDESEPDKYHSNVCSICGDVEDGSKTEHNIDYLPNGEQGHLEYCSGCGYTSATIEHNFVTNESTHQHECEYCQYVDTTAHEYVYVENGDGTHDYECSKCGDELVTNQEHTLITYIGENGHYQECQYCDYVSSEEEHTYSYTDNSDGTHTGNCSVCGDITTTDHTYGEWVTTTEATTTSEGEEIRTCTGCGHTETQVIDMKVDNSKYMWLWLIIALEGLVIIGLSVGSSVIKKSN